MYCDLWPYVWLIIESGFKSRAAYGGARTVVVMPQIGSGRTVPTTNYQRS